jgi:hypothetical protein
MFNYSDKSYVDIFKLIPEGNMYSIKELLENLIAYSKEKIQEKIGGNNPNNLDEAVEDSNLDMHLAKLGKQIYLKASEVEALRPTLQYGNKFIAGKKEGANFNISIDKAGIANKPYMSVNFPVNSNLGEKVKNLLNNEVSKIKELEIDEVKDSPSNIVLMFKEIGRKTKYADEKKSKEQKQALAKKVGQSSMPDVKRAQTAQVNLELKNLVKKIYVDLKKSGFNPKFDNIVTDKTGIDDRGRMRMSNKELTSDNHRKYVYIDLIRATGKDFEKSLNMSEGQNYLDVYFYPSIMTDEKEEEKELALKIKGIVDSKISSDMQDRNVKDNLGGFHILIRIKPKGRKDQVTEE